MIIPLHILFYNNSNTNYFTIGYTQSSIDSYTNNITIIHNYRTRTKRKTNYITMLYTTKL